MMVLGEMLECFFTLFCFKCKDKGPNVSMKQDGTMVTVMQTCANCGDNFVWRSQPLVLGKYPAGNILLSFAILMPGASVNKILLIFLKDVQNTSTGGSRVTKSSQFEAVCF